MTDTSPPNPWAISEAEHNAASLHNRGWDVGAGATIWARVVKDISGPVAGRKHVTAGRVRPVDRPRGDDRRDESLPISE